MTNNDNCFVDNDTPESLILDLPEEEIDRLFDDIISNNE